MRKILGCFIIIMIMITSQIYAATYYVDATNGSDSNSGTSPEIAWKTINKVNNSSFNPGDSILFKRGEVWREQLVVPSSGSINNPIVIGDYGAGDKPTINGADLVTSWMFGYDNIWQAACTTEPNQVFFDGVRGTKAANLGAVDAENEWFWDSNVLYVYYTEDPDGAVTIEASSRACISIDTKDYIDITGLTLTKPNSHGVATNTATYLNVYNNTISYTGKRAIHVNNGTNHCAIYNNTISYCGADIATQEHGIYIDASDDVDVYLNEISHSWDNGLKVDGGNRIKIYRNYFHDNNDEDIVGAADILIGEYEADTTDIEIDYNIFKSGNSYSIYSESFGAYDVTGMTIYNNSFYGFTDDYIIRIEDSINCTVKNNVFYARGDYVFLYDDNTNFSSDYNCYYNWQHATNIGYSETAYVTWATWNGTETNSINANPSMTDPANDDFTLKMASPCVNAGTDVGLTEDYAGNTVPNGWAVDIGAYEYQGSISPLSAEINASPTSGYVPLAVSFTGSVSGGTAPYSYSWDFGDGSSSSDQNPSYTYNSAGTYTVTLTVTDSSSSEATDSLIITATSPTSALSASGSASPTSGQVPLAVSFTGSASGGTAPYTYSWNFGDGSSSSDKNPSHTYSSAGTYTVTLTITDSSISQATDSLIITATLPTSALSASGSASPTSGETPLTVNFTGSASGGTSPYTYSWNFGDGSSSSSQNPSHTYSSAGTYSITLTVTDSASSQASASIAITASSQVHEVTVPNTPEGPSTGAPGISYTYTTGGSSCSQGHSVEYYFDWGDGTYSSWSSSTSASHIWSAAGTYTVKVQARCTVNPGVTSLWSEAKTVSLEESSNFQLYISSATASPASGQGGSTNPNTGTYSYPAGNSVQVTTLPAANYRFSKWTGDISGSDSYNSEITFNMDQDKSISALFCTQCGDVNGDLSITPADAQYVFEMFLGIISNATETQKENADVNCDGTATEPNITPADAQAIFEKFLGISELPGDCSCRSRADASSTAFTQNNRSRTAPLEIQSGTPNIQLTIDDIDARFKREITVPVHINNPFNIKSFGFDLIFESGTLEFAGIEIGSLLNGFTMVDANEISEGVVRVGGFSSEPIMTSSPSVLVRLKFRVSGRVKEPSPLSITNTVDDIKNAATSSGVVFYKEINDKIMRNKNVF